MRRRSNDGHIYERHGAFHVRYYTTSPSGERVQKSHKLIDKPKGSRWKCNAGPVVEACKVFMATLAQLPTEVTAEVVSNADDQKLSEFWTSRFLPYIEEVLPLTGEARKKPSTVRSYPDGLQQGCHQLEPAPKSYREP